MAWVPYDSYLKNLMTGEDTWIDHDDSTSTTFKIALLVSTHTPSTSNDDMFADVVGDEVSGSGYTQGGNELSTPTVTVSTGTVTWDAADPATWSQNDSGFSNAQYAILYKDTGSDSTANLIAYNDFGSNKGNVSGDLTVQLSTSGIATLS